MPAYIIGEISSIIKEISTKTNMKSRADLFGIRNNEVGRKAISRGEKLSATHARYLFLCTQAILLCKNT